MESEFGYLQSKEENQNLKINRFQNKKYISKKYIPINYTQASFLSKILYLWAKPAISLANKRPLKNKDVCKISPEQSISKNISTFKSIFYEKSSNKKNGYPLFISIVSLHYKSLLFLFFLNMADVGLEYTRIYFFKKIISIFSEGNFFPDRKINILDLYHYKFNIIESIIIFISIKLIASFLSNYAELKSAILNRIIINETSALLMEKLLKSNSINNSFSKGEGEKINLIEIDAEKIGFFFFWAPKILTFPIKIAISLYLLFTIFGHNFIYAFLGLIASILIIIFFQSIYNRNIKYLLYFKDKRMKIVTYVFQVLKNIKLNSWEDEFIKRIDIKRNEEMRMLSKLFNLEVMIGVLNKNLNLILMTLTLTVFVLSKDEIEISSLFTSFQLINTITIPLKVIPLFLAQLVGNLVSIKRLQLFLLSEDYYNNRNKSIVTNDIVIKMENASFGVKNTIEKNAKINLNINQGMKEEILLLENISFSIKNGEFIGIIGGTGAGKTCLLNAIMNNYQIVSSSSEPEINGEISFCPSQPWIMTESIKNNILFFSKDKEMKYNEIVSLCCLTNDFEKLSDGDDTMINSTCSNISEGQKVRISLARCLYQETDIYLIDDIFSPLDKSIRYKIFQNAICNYLKSKTRIIVLNEKSFIPFVDKIIFMKKRKIVFFGNYEEYKEFNKQNEDNNDEDIKESNESIKKENKKIKDSQDSNENSDNNLIFNEFQNANDVLNTVSTSKISCKTYLYYIKIQGGFIVFITLIILIIIVKSMELYRSTIIPKLAKSYKEISKDRKLKSHENDFFILNIKKTFYLFLKISIATIILNFIIRFTTTRISIYAMRIIHRNMIYRLVKAPINLFHDLVPVGQILNRLTQDIEIIQNIIRTVNSFIKLLFSLASCMIICYIYNKTIIFLSPIIVSYIIVLTSYYLIAGRNLTRLQRISYSPIMTIFSETIRGLDIIRTSHVEENTKKKFFEKIDERYGIYLFGEGCKRWHAVRRSIFIQLMFGVIILYMAYYSDTYSVRAIAIILQYTEEFLLHLIDISLFYIELENSMIGLERCEQIVKIEKEKENNNETQISENWSKNGDIEFVNYNASYRPNTPVILKNINLKIKSGEKVGIVGKTGSGKSSLINALARIIEPKEGNILIDGVDIQNISLKILREKISILPQESFIIESTLRDNIDPLNKYTDDDILKIVDDLCMFKNLEKNKKLNFEIKENGKNLSTGEKKLICFARTIIKRNKIVIIDEATSSLDSETKKIIIDNVENYLKDSTMIIISNQIEMLKKCDIIVVIDNGKIVESGKYENLIINKKSLFYSLFIK